MGAAVSSIWPLALACAACTSVIVDARTFEGTRWHVTAIDGRATPAGADYHVEFRGGEIMGRFGCNSWGGSYRVSGPAITTNRIIGTQMGCPEPAMTFERTGLSILQRPVRWTFRGERKLTLSNATGAIVLERLP